MAAAVPAMLSFAGTMATVISTIVMAPKQKDLPRPEIDEKKADQEIIDAAKRRGRTTFAGHDTLLAGGPVGSKLTLGIDDSSQTLIGD